MRDYDVLAGQYDDLAENWAARGAEINRLRAENAHLRAALLAVEWTHAYPAMGDAWCIWCSNIKPFGHRADCARQIALGLVEVAQ